MVYNVYSIRDNKTAFMQPLYDQSDASAIRGFARAINNEGTIFDFAPADFDLYMVGTFDDQSGELKAVSPIRFVASGSSLVGYKVGASYEK